MRFNWKYAITSGALIILVAANLRSPRAASFSSINGKTYKVSTSIPRILNPLTTKIATVSVQTADQATKSVGLFESSFDYPILMWADRYAESLLIIYHFDVEDTILVVDLASTKTTCDLPSRLRPIVKSTAIHVRLPSKDEIARLSTALRNQENSKHLGEICYAAESYGRRSSSQLKQVLDFVDGFTEVVNE
jgi:hypothetical protein